MNHSDLISNLKHLKSESLSLSAVPDRVVNRILDQIGISLLKHKEEIYKANLLDLAHAKKEGKNSAFIDRLRVTEKTISDMIASLKVIQKSDSPIGIVKESRTVSNGLQLQKYSVPLGVVAVIYESRPNVTLDVAALCLKSRNGVVLKGGSLSGNTNRILVTIIHDVLKSEDVDPGVILMLDQTDHETVRFLLRQNKYIDVVIPRGGYDLVKTVVKLSRIPILYHAAGGARIYIDKSADLKMAGKICLNAKISRPATCNSLDCIVIHQDIAEKLLPTLYDEFSKNGVELVGDSKVCRIIPIKKATETDWDEEYLRLKCSLKVVADLKEAIRFISRHSKGHTEGIVSGNQGIINEFIRGVDAAAIMVNASTRLHDGGVFGLGAEMGIATGKLHVRGPVGLSDLTTYKWIATGKGQVRE